MGAVAGGEESSLLSSQGGTGGSQTRRWRKADSNSWSHPERQRSEGSPRSDYVGCIRARGKVGVNENDNTRTPGAFAGPTVRIRLPPAANLVRT